MSAGSATEAATPAEDESREAVFQREMRRHLRRNYAAHLAHGLLGQTGFRLIQAPTFIPAYLFELSGSNLVVGLARAMQALGMSATPLFAATLVEHRRRVIPAAFVVGGLMRVQILGIALAGFLLSGRLSVLATCLFLGGFGFFLGMQGVVFSTLVSKVIPVERRGVLMGLRNFLSGITGGAVGLAGGAFVDRAVLGNGYATTFLVSFVLTAVGLSCLAFVREPEAPAVRARSSVGRRLRELPALLRADPAFTRYFLARGLATLGRAAVPFYVLYAASRSSLSGTQLGQLTGVFLLAWSCCNLFWGAIADRVGFRMIFLCGLSVWILATVLLMQTTGFGALLAVFVGLGAGWGGFMLSANNMVLEFGSRENLPMRIAVANTTSELMGAAGPIAAGLLADAASYLLVFWIAIACKALAFAVVVFSVDEPRRRGAAGPA